MHGSTYEHNNGADCRNGSMSTALTQFLTGSGKDHKGRRYYDILNQDDRWLERTHDWVQWCFPLFERSQAVMTAPRLKSFDEVAQIQKSASCQENMRLGLIRYAEFLRDNDQWLRHHDHNHLRITRVIKSAKLLMSAGQAEDFFQYVLGQIDSRAQSFPLEVAINYWRSALSGESNEL